MNGYDIYISLILFSWESFVQEAHQSSFKPWHSSLNDFKKWFSSP
jgi:hypothetical protein